MHNLELEQNVLGLALLGDPIPDWIEPEHFWNAQNRMVFDAVSELGVMATLPNVAALLRERGQLYTKYHGPDRHSKPGMLNSHDLVEMMEGARFCLRCGWAIDFEELRELADQRALLAKLQETVTRVRTGYWTAFEAKKELSRICSH